MKGSEEKIPFFELLQVAIGNRDKLSRTLSPDEWEEMYDECKRQTMVGIGFAGVERLPQEQLPPGRRIRQWAVKADKIREQNAKVSAECVQVSRFFERNGFDCVILKGQGNYAYYPEHLQGLRGTGDIDVWVRPCYENEDDNLNHNHNANLNLNDNLNDNLNHNHNANLNLNVNDTQGKPCYDTEQSSYDTSLQPYDTPSATIILNQREARQKHPVRAVVEFCLSVKKGEYVYYHNMDFPILKGTAVEVHYRPTWLYNPFRNGVLQRWFRQEPTPTLPKGKGQEGKSSKVSKVQRFQVYNGYRIPSVEFNVVFQLLHLYKHIFEEGIGLRQLLDYYFVITSYVTLRYDTERSSYDTQGKACYDNLNLNVNHNLNPNPNPNLDLEPLNFGTLELIKKLGLEGFAGAVMYVLQEVFAMQRERMLWEPDEKRGKKLLEEIMTGGNFGKFDERYNWAETTNGSMEYRGASYAFARFRHNARFLWNYPSEVLWEPVFRVYHWVWRRFKLWRFE